MSGLRIDVPARRARFEFWNPRLPSIFFRGNAVNLPSEHTNNNKIIRLTDPSSMINRGLTLELSEANLRIDTTNSRIDVKDIIYMYQLRISRRQEKRQYTVVFLDETGTKLSRHQPLKAFCKDLGINYHTLAARISLMSWPIGLVPQFESLVKDVVRRSGDRAAIAAEKLAARRETGYYFTQDQVDRIQRMQVDIGEILKDMAAGPAPDHTAGSEPSTQSATADREKS